MNDEKKGPDADAEAAAAAAGRKTSAGEPRPANGAGDTPQGTTGQGTTGQSTTGAEPRPDAAQLEAIIKALQDEIGTHADANLRMRAEMENLRKRFEREKADTAKYAITKFAQDVVNVGDNFQRAISAVPPGAADQDQALRSFLDGILLAEREFINVLERHGVVRLDPKGEPFNPKIHNAVMEQENRDVAAGTVLQVFQAGYMIEDRCLKPALVVVSRGGVKPAKPMADAGADRPKAADQSDATGAGDKPSNENGGSRREEGPSEGL